MFTMSLPSLELTILKKKINNMYKWISLTCNTIINVCVEQHIALGFSSIIVDMERTKCQGYH